MPTTSQRHVYRKVGKKSLCRKMRISKPNKCKNAKTCRVARGTKRTYCRKKKAKRYSKRNPNPNDTFGVF